MKTRLSRANSVYSRNPKKNDYNEGRPGWAADGYADGTLRAIVEETERAFGYRKQVGLAPLLDM